MDTNDAIRHHVLQLMKLGVNQKELAKRMNVSESWFSRWVNEKRPRIGLTVRSMDSFRSYVRALLDALIPMDATEADIDFETTVERIRHDPEKIDAATVALRRLLVSQRPGGVVTAQHGQQGTRTTPQESTGRRGRRASS